MGDLRVSNTNQIESIANVSYARCPGNRDSSHQLVPKKKKIDITYGENYILLERY